MAYLCCAPTFTKNHCCTEILPWYKESNDYKSLSKTIDRTLEMEPEFADPTKFNAIFDAAMKKVNTEGYACAFYSQDGAILAPPGVSIGSKASPPFPGCDQLLYGKKAAFDNKEELVAPSPAATVCCHLCPFVCQCKPRLALKGLTEIDAHPVIAGIVVTGSAQTAANDLAVAVALADSLGLAAMTRS